jgi:hypothetical protein
MQLRTVSLLFRTQTVIADPARHFSTWPPTAETGRVMPETRHRRFRRHYEMRLTVKLKLALAFAMVILL